MSHEHTLGMCFGLKLALTFITVAGFSLWQYNNNRSSWSCVCLPGWVQLHGLLTKWDVVFPWWSRAKATRFAFQNFTSLKWAAQHCHNVAEYIIAKMQRVRQNKHLLLVSYSTSASHHVLLFTTEPADGFDVLPTRWPHRLPGGLSEESQGARRNRQGAVGYLRGPGEEASSPSQRWPVTQVPFQKWWEVNADWLKLILLCFLQENYNIDYFQTLKCEYLLFALVYGQNNTFKRCNIRL